MRNSLLVLVAVAMILLLDMSMYFMGSVDASEYIDAKEAIWDRSERQMMRVQSCGDRALDDRYQCVIEIVHDINHWRPGILLASMVPLTPDVDHELCQAAAQMLDRVERHYHEHEAWVDGVELRNAIAFNRSFVLKLTHGGRQPTFNAGAHAMRVLKGVRSSVLKGEVCKFASW